MDECTSFGPGESVRISAPKPLSMRARWLGAIATCT